MNEGKAIITTALQQVGIENIDTNCTFTDLASLITSKLGNKNVKLTVATTSGGVAFTAPYTGKIVVVPFFQACSTGNRSDYSYWLYDSTTSTYYYNNQNVRIPSVYSDSFYQHFQTTPIVIDAIKDHKYISNGQFTATSGWTGIPNNKCYWIYIDTQE